MRSAPRRPILGRSADVARRTIGPVWEAAVTPVCSFPSCGEPPTRFPSGTGRSRHGRPARLHQGSRRCSCPTLRHLPRPYGGLSVESEGRREVPVGLDLRLQIGDLLLRGGNGIGAGDEAARRRLLAPNDDERSRELGGITGLQAILGFPERELLRSALVVVLDRRLGVVR